MLNTETKTEAAKVTRNIKINASPRDLVITRVIAAPAYRVFEAYSKPELVRQWFGPKPYPLTLCEMDFKEGGTYRFAMTGPDGKQLEPFGGEYIEIVDNKKIAFTNRTEKPGSDEMFMTISFSESGGSTTVESLTVFASAEHKREQEALGFEQGINTALDQLAALVTTKV